VVGRKKEEEKEESGEGRAGEEESSTSLGRQGRRGIRLRVEREMDGTGRIWEEGFF